MVVAAVDGWLRAATRKVDGGENGQEVGSGGAGAGECVHLNRKSLTSLALTTSGVPPSAALTARASGDDDGGRLVAVVAAEEDAGCTVNVT